jgi:ORF6N domain
MKSKKLEPMLPVTTVEGRIHLVRGRKVILDRDLAELYGVPTKALNQAVKRNLQRFPDEFVFRVAKEEADALRSQSVTLIEPDPNRSQIVTGSQKHRDPRSLPYAFTEHGALMAANVLRSPRAIQMSVVIVQTFVRLSRMAVSMDALARRVEELGHATSENSAQIKKIVAAIRELMTPPEPTRREIGFHAPSEGTGPASKRGRIRER